MASRRRACPRWTPESRRTAEVGRLFDRLGLENAIHHNKPGSRVQLRVDAEGGRPRLRVTNTGPPIPADQVARLLGPFQRLAVDRVQSGHRRADPAVHGRAVG